MSRSVEVFSPIDTNMVTMYSCGPTVYSRQHLGNLRSAFLVDLYKNVIKYIGGYAVRHVVNITDVGHLTGDNEGDADHGEDRMEKGARQQGVTAWDVAEMFTKIYLEDLALLKIDSFERVTPTSYTTMWWSQNLMPRATDHIAEQIAIVQELEKKWLTYIIEGDGVYMDTSTVWDYGKLIGKKHMDGLEQWSRIDDAGKRNATDFALWKFNITWKKRDMERDSPWGVGFPGWHIECSAMSMEYLGNQIDIHTGGMEHIAIHHTNEICQSECSHGHTPRVNYWLHNQRLMMNGKKIAKSDGNVAFMSEVIERGYTWEDLRYFFLQAHYRSFQDFTREGLEAASKARKRMKNEKLRMKNSVLLWEKLTTVLWGRIAECLAHDFDTPRAIATLHEAKANLSDEEINDIYYLDTHILKLWLFDTEQIIEISAEIQQLAEQRRQAKIQKNRALADQLRAELDAQWWTMNDGKEGYDLVKN